VNVHTAISSVLDSNLGVGTFKVTAVNDPLTGAVSIAGDSVQVQALTAGHKLA
jgi:hypothetical protein